MALNTKAIINAAKVLLPEPSTHFFSELKMPVQYMGIYYKVKFTKQKQRAPDGQWLEKWYCTEEIETIKGGLKAPVQMLY